MCETLVPWLLSNKVADLGTHHDAGYEGYIVIVKLYVAFIPFGNKIIR